MIQTRKRGEESGTTILIPWSGRMQGLVTDRPVPFLCSAEAAFVTGPSLRGWRLFANGEASGKQTLPYWLVGGFAGLRRAEIERLEWKDIHFDRAKHRAFTQAIATGNKEAIGKAEKEWRASALIEVPALKAKTASRRFVQIQDNLAAWLEPYIRRTGNVCPPNLRKLLEADRKAAGLKHWPSNALRHSFASYHLAKFNDQAKLAIELGHTDQELLHRHYRELVKPEQAEKYWNIRPETEANVVAISA